MIEQAVLPSPRVTGELLHHLPAITPAGLPPDSECCLRFRMCFNDSGRLCEIDIIATTPSTWEGLDAEHKSDRLVHRDEDHNLVIAGRYLS